MKPFLILFASILLPATSLAQNSTSRSRVSRSPVPLKTVPSRTVSKPAQVTAATNPITENITLQLKDDFQSFVVLDMELTGVGPRFTTDLIIPASEKKEPPVVITFESIVVLTAPDKYQVDYNIGARIPIVSNTMTRPDGSTSRNIEYRDISLSGSAKLTQGKAVTLSKLNGKALTLNIIKPAE